MVLKLQAWISLLLNDHNKRQVRLWRDCPGDFHQPLATHVADEICLLLNLKKAHFTDDD
jgi:hypothetical protein